jgi:Transglycosylase SLT domain
VLRRWLNPTETDRSEHEWGTGQGASSLRNAAAETARNLALASTIRTSTPTGAAGGATGDGAPANVGGGVKGQVQAVANRYGWGGGAEWSALDQLVEHESSWNPSAQNPTSTAYGLFQFLNGTWAGTGIGKTGDVNQQAEAGMRYIKNRYGSPAAAWAFWQKNHWY